MRYSIGIGNNSKLIRDAMQKREGWFEVPCTDPSFHFKWMPVSHPLKFEQLNNPNINQHPDKRQIVNHLEKHGNLSEKSKLFLNMLEYAQKKGENVFDFMPLTYFVSVEVSKYALGQALTSNP